MYGHWQQMLNSVQRRCTDTMKSHSFVIREARSDDLAALLALYTHLHEQGIPESTEHLAQTWETICNDSSHHIIVCEAEGQIVASCVCVVIPNLTRNIRPYALIENVVTHTQHRKKGYATACLDFAKEIAVQCNCYKIMLLTGSKNESTLRFYERAGYNSNDKTGMILWL